MIGQTRLHRGSNSEARMNAAEIVIREVQGHSGFQMRELFRERIGQSRKSSHRHSHSQVLPLHKRSADVIGIGIALSDFGYNPRDAWWGVPRFGRIELPVVAKHLRELREVAIRSKALRRGHGVVVQSVRGELHAVCDPLIQVPQEGPCIGAHALADAKRGNELGFCVNRNVNPLVSEFGRVTAPHVPAFLADVSLDFVNLQIPGAEIPHSRVHQSGTMLSRNEQEMHDRIAIESSEPFCTADRAPFQKAMQRTHSRVCAGTHCPERRSGPRIAEGNVAGLAGPTLNTALNEVPKSLAGLVLAFGAGHVASPLDFCGGTRHNRFSRSRAWVTPRFGLDPTTARTAARALRQVFWVWG